MNLNEVLAELEANGSPSIKKVLLNHGAAEPFFGVKIEYLKKMVSRIKKNYELSLELYKTGNSDAMYLAGLIADEKKMTKEDLKNWVDAAYWSMLSDYTVPWVAAESDFGAELAQEWIESNNEGISTAGWSTYSSLVSITPDNMLDIDHLSSLIDRVVKEIHQAPNRTRNAMNGFIIAVGSYVPALTEKALDAGKKIGKVSVFMGNTACRVPSIVEYIQKVKDKNKLGVKRKMARC